MAMEPEPSNPIPAMETYEPLQMPVVVIGSQFLQHYPVHLTVSESNSSGAFKITDVKGTLIFQVKSKGFSIHDRSYLKGAAGNTILSYRAKLMTMHQRREVFKGKNQDEGNLLFTAKKSKRFQFKNTGLDIFLANNTAEKNPDFKIKGDGTEGSCTVYLGNGESNTIIAKMQRHFGGNFVVTTYPNVDYAFTVGLMGLVFLDDEISPEIAAQIAGASAETAANIVVAGIS